MRNGLALAAAALGFLSAAWLAATERAQAQQLARVEIVDEVRTALRTSGLDPFLHGWVISETAGHRKPGPPSRAASG